MDNRSEKVIKRPGLFYTYNDEMNWDVLLVSAPPGSGKSTLLDEWYCYYSQRDNCSAFLWSSSNFDFDEILKLIANEPAGTGIAEIKQCRYFILDDFECMHDDPRAAQEILKLIKASPAQCKFIFTSTLPPKTLYAEFAELHVMTMPASALFLSERETKAYVEKFCPVNSDALESVEHLYWMTEGWPLGLRFALQSFEKYPDTFNFSEYDSNNEFVDSYFRARVLNRLPADLITFSLETSFVDELSAPLCDCIMHDNTSAAKLERLADINPFLIKIDCRGMYRYCHLFAEWLQSQLLQFHESQIRTLSTNASVWYSQNKDSINKARMLTLATDPSCLIPLLNESCLAEQVSSSSELYFFILSHTNEKCLENELPCCFLSLWTYVGFGQYDEIMSWADRLETILEGIALDTQEQLYYRLSIATARAVAHSILNHNHESIMMCNSVLEESDIPINSMIKFHLYYSLSNNYERVGDFERAIDCCLLANAHAMSCGARDCATFPNYKKSQILISQGQFDEVEALSESSIPLTNEDSPLRRAFFVLLARTQIETLQIDDAKKNIRKSLSNLVLLKNPEVYVDAQIAHFECLMAENRLDQAHEDILKTISMFEDSKIPSAGIAFAFISLGQVSICRNSLMGLVVAHDQLQQDSLIDDKFFSLYLLLFDAVRHKYEQDYDKALILLDKTIHRAAALDFNTPLIEALIQKALVLECLGEEERATQVFYEALLIGKKYGYRATITKTGKPIVALLKKVKTLKRDLSPVTSYVDTLLQAMGLHNAMSEEKEYLLTAREQEVLSLVNEGKSRQEISTALFISINTTKTHIKNIRRKLNQ